MEFTNELLEKAKKAESAEALQALAKENDYNMSAEEANAYFAQLHKSGELSDEELENVSGGGCRNNGHLVVTVAYGCRLWMCKKDDAYSYMTGFNLETDTYTYACSKCQAAPHCYNCKYCRYEKGLWLCYHPEK